jgi:PAS domain S-box-containing protein
MEEAVEAFLSGDSEMARRISELDWSQTVLGPIQQWPQSLRTSVSIALDCAFPIVIWWGPELAILYNDEYRAILGPSKHPSALGQRGALVWAEIWDVVGPMLARVKASGQATRSRDLMLHIDREGYAEEAYFSFSYSPIYAEDGEVGGIFCPVIETTEKIIAERRLRTLRDLAARCKGAESEGAAYQAAAAVLTANPHDVPFALIYRIDDEGAFARLNAAAGIQPGVPAAPEVVALERDGADAWSLSAVVCSGKSALLTDLARRFESLPTGAWKVPAHSALVMPVSLPGQEHPRAILVAAISPMRALNEDYCTFLGLVATQIAAGLADAQALEEERRRAEALAEVDRAKTAFFSNVSHEFRTPLALMLGPLEDALASEAGTVSDNVAASLRVAHRNSLRLLKLVNTLLDFSRIEAGRVEASYEPTDIAAMTAELASVFRSAIEKAGLQLIIDCPPLDERAYVDRDMWEKVVLNLLSNALKFTFEGHISVVLRRREQRFVLTVSDTGVGIPARDLPRMFQRFQRVKNVRSRTHEGSGIGLAFVQELVNLHGGDVTVQSEEGRGSAFTVNIPAGIAHLPPDRISAERRLASTSLGAGPFIEEAMRWLPASAQDTRASAFQSDALGGIGASAPALDLPRSAARECILIADDNADMRDYLHRLLARSYDVVCVADGQAALDEIRASRPALVLTDVMMPRLDGFGLLAAIRAEAATRTLPVIMLSARAGEEARIEGRAAGADDYVIKPFSARELQARIGSQLELARLRREAARALRYRGEQFETLFSEAPLGVYLVDADFRIREVNPVARPVFGLVPGGVVGRDFDEIIHMMWRKEYADEIVRIYRHTLATGEPHVTLEHGEFRIDRGRTEYYEWRLNRITLPDGRYGLVCYFRDISAQVLARKQIEESREALKEADRRKDEFLAMLAHELRNPLAPMRNGLELMKLAAGDPETIAQARVIMQRQVEQMVRLVDDLLDVSRISRGAILLRRERVQIAAIVRSAIETSRPMIEVSEHKLLLDVPAEPIFVDADETRLAQVFTNLLNNAAKYTPPGGRIRVTVDRRGDAAMVSVADNGRGIPAHSLTKVFDMFTQVDRSFDKWQPGLGVGLSIAKRLVEMHGGSIEARSGGRGTGSEFIVRVPVLLSLVSGAVAAGADERSDAGLGRRVLIADDNEDAALSTAIMLKLMGCETQTAHNGRQALEVAAAFRPEVVLLDIGMPGLDGYETCRRLRKHGWGQAMIVVAVTGWGQDVDRQTSEDAGFDLHLVKPADPAALRAVLGRTRVAAA